MTTKPEDMNPKDLNKAIKSSYGKILEDWKSIDLLPSKDTVTNKQLKPIQAKAYSTTFRGKPLEYQLLNKL